jgi:hypothetical protein
MKRPAGFLVSLEAMQLDHWRVRPIAKPTSRPPMSERTIFDLICHWPAGKLSGPEHAEANSAKRAPRLR